ncbi:alpha-galactosidase [bacterium]|nr:alpha-galactosidase [bacterium]
MSDKISIAVLLNSGKRILFSELVLGEEYENTIEGIFLHMGKGMPMPITVVSSAPDEFVASIEYNLYTDIKNYHTVIVPDCGRSFSNKLQLVDFWNFNEENTVCNIKMPIYIFTGQDKYTSMAFGIIGENYETRFQTLEPKADRALVVYMRRLSLQIKRGTEFSPIPERVSQKNSDHSIREYIYFRRLDEKTKQPWLLTLRDFAEHQKTLYNLPDITCKTSMSPLWCSWTDWFSNNVTDKVIMENVKEGLSLGIKNYIIDDGWFGPGLDSDYEIELNIGDWRPDPDKICNMKKLVSNIKKLGGRPLIWCAPHAVAKAADCFEKRKKYLIRKKSGELFLTPNKFHSLCFMCPQARDIMADICAGFISEWDFDGAKYDLFNCVVMDENGACASTEHEHDTHSMIEGLSLTMELIAKKCRALKQDYIIELKQNYGTPFLAQWGTMMRAGDTPYNSEGNFQRTLYNQAYTPYSVNDYQTITSEDSPIAAAVIIIKMIAVGIPSYSIDFSRLNAENKRVLAHYNNWYNDNVDVFMNYRQPLDADNNIFKIPASQLDYYFLVNEGGEFMLNRSAVVINGTFKEEFHIRCADKKNVELNLFDHFGVKTEKISIAINGHVCIPVSPGGMAEVDFK